VLLLYVVDAPAAVAAAAAEPAVLVLQHVVAAGAASAPDPAATVLDGAPPSAGFAASSAGTAGKHAVRSAALLPSAGAAHRGPPRGPIAMTGRPT